MSLISKDKAQTKSLQRIKFFVTSPSRLLVLSFFTFGIYPVYWQYKNWKAIKDAKKIAISPFWRSIFSLFFIFYLFEAIRQTAVKKGYKIGFSAGVLATAYIISGFAGNVLGRVPGYHLGVSLAMVALLFINSLCLMFAQQMINFSVPPATKAKLALEPVKATWAEITVIIGGLIFFSLAMIGLFVPDSAIRPASSDQSRIVNAQSVSNHGDTDNSTHSNGLSKAAQDDAKAQATASSVSNTPGSAGANTTTKRSTASTTPAAVAPPVAALPAPQATVSSNGWTAYSNNAFGVSLQYPASGPTPYNWNVDEQVYPNPSGNLPQLMVVNFAIPTGQRYGETARLEVHSGTFNEGVAFYDSYYASMTLTSFQKSATSVNGKLAILYSSTSYGEPTRLYLIDDGDKFVIFNSVHGSLNLGRFTDYWSDFGKVVNSLVLR